jgi:hypothetical protein
MSPATKIDLKGKLYMPAEGGCVACVLTAGRPVTAEEVRAEVNALIIEGRKLHLGEVVEHLEMAIDDGYISVEADASGEFVVFRYSRNDGPEGKRLWREMLVLGMFYELRKEGG